MKYIRTADGIIDCEDSKWRHPATYPEQAYMYAITKKVAGTIEELCDMYVVDDGSNEPLICENFEELKYWFNYNKKQQCKTNNCYGAIWTSKGLIFVAKLNKEGELELL